MTHEVDHALAHIYIAALSCTKDGRELIEALENVRYYHSEGKIADLGHDGVFVAAVDAYDGEEEMGAILLPGTKDRLTYQTADFLDNSIKGALFWQNSHSYPVVIPYVLGEWAAECIIERSDYSPIPVRDTKPILNRIDIMPDMYVRMPKGLQLPGLTQDKHAKRKAVKPQGYVAEPGYHITHFVFQDPIVEGYGYNAHVLYGVSGGDIAYALDVVDALDVDDIDDILTGNHIFNVEPEAWRAICQLKSNLEHWAYFDACTLNQCVKHVIEGNYDPEEDDTDASGRGGQDA